MSDYTIVEKYQQGKSATIAVRPFFSPNKENMGLEQYGLSLHDGVYHEENLACLEMNGVKRYITGLNEFDPKVKMLSKDEKKKKVKEIREVVAQLEAELAANVVDPNDKDFWNKLTIMKPDNSKFWDKISLRCGNDPVFLDPDTDPYDLIKLHAINAGGFSIVAKSLREAKEMNNPPKFYLDTVQESLSTRTELSKIKNRALVELQKMYDSNTAKLIYVAKICDVDSVQYIKSTPNDILYENMDNYINGFGAESSKKKAASQFLEVAGLTMEDLKIRALIKDALYYRFITTKAGGWIEPIDSGIRLGKRPSEVLEFLKKPENDEALSSILEKVEPYWNS
ncbi:MAG: hypothetical protein K0U52_03630 [Gammaproteobacteria bacterium]|jgi:hypothetical protein|nr:hypothetical protein [Gammaproteobacteria bacterium]